MRLPHARLSLCLILALAAACSAAREPEGPRIEAVADLRSALTEAGVDVAETAIMPSLTTPPGGRVVYLGDEQVEMYEAESEAAQRDEVQQLLRRLPAVSPPNVWGRGRVIVLYAGQDGATIALLSGLMGDSLTLSAPAPDEPYPPAVVAAIGWLADEIEVEAIDVSVIAFEPVEWPDACLGLAEPDEMCAGVITPGWRVTLQVDDREITVRTDELGSAVRQEA
jgi:hypothetical protein